jgi:hypothetical protein
MDDMTRRAHLERLHNPKMPNPFFSHDYGVPARELPPRRTLRERLRALLWWRRRVR